MIDRSIDDATCCDVIGERPESQGKGREGVGRGSFHFISRVTPQRQRQRLMMSRISFEDCVHLKVYNGAQKSM